MSSTSALSSTEAAEVQQVVPNANDGTSTATVATPTAAVPDLPEVCDDHDGARPPLPVNAISEEEEKKMKGKKNMSTPSTPAPPGRPAAALPEVLGTAQGKIIAGLIGVLLLVIALITIVFVVLNPADPPPASKEPTSSPRPSSTSNPSASPATERLQVIVAGLYDLSSRNFELTPSNVLDDPASSQSLALKWLTNKDSAYIDMAYPDAGEENDALLLQRYALVQLYYATVGANWTSSAGFLTPNEPECTWVNDYSWGKGVSQCDSQGRVTKLNLLSNNLRGTLPEELSLLTRIEYLDFQGNDLYGPLPGVYSGLTKMNLFDVSYNELTGTIPNEYGSGWSDSLEDFNVDSNNLTGTIPSTMASSSKLKRAFFLDNEFVGTMPKAFCDLPELETLFSDCLTEVTCSCCTGCY